VSLERKNLQNLTASKDSVDATLSANKREGVWQKMMINLMMLMMMMITRVPKWKIQCLSLLNSILIRSDVISLTTFPFKNCDILDFERGVHDVFEIEN
jgi:hypothetical protein